MRQYPLDFVMQLRHLIAGWGFRPFDRGARAINRMQDAIQPTSFFLRRPHSQDRAKFSAYGRHVRSQRPFGGGIGKLSLV